MLFRIWYHCCQLAILAMLAVFFGMTLNLALLVDVARWVLLPIGTVGILLGLLGVTTGMRTACPKCGRKASWIYARKFLGIHCGGCGIYGGYPMLHLLPFKVYEVDPTEGYYKAVPFEECWK